MKSLSAHTDIAEATRVADRIINRDAMADLVAPFGHAATTRFVLYPHGVFLDPAQFDALSRVGRTLGEAWMFFLYLGGVEGEPAAHRLQVGDLAYYQTLTAPLDNALISPTGRWALLSFWDGFGLVGADSRAGGLIRRTLSVDLDAAYRGFVEHHRETAAALGDDGVERHWVREISDHLGYDRSVLDAIWHSDRR